MGLPIELSIYLISICSSILFKKINIIVVALSCMFVILFTYAPVYIEDYSNYLFAYSQLQTSTGRFEWGYTKISSIFFQNGYSFIDFRLFISIVVVAVLVTAFKLFRSNITLMLCLYFIFPFFIDIIQIRNFVVVAFLTLGAAILSTDWKGKYLISITSLLIGASFHSIGYFYCFAVIIFFLIERHVNKLLFVIPMFVIFVLALLSVVPVTRELMGSIVSTVSTSYAGSYFGSSMNTHFIFIWIIQFILMGIGIPLLKDDLDKRSRTIANIYFSFVILTFFAMPLYVANGSTLRIIRNIFPIVFVTLPVSMRYSNKYLNKSFVLFMFIAMMALGCLLQYSHLFYQSLMPILNDNTWNIFNVHNY